VLLARGDLDAAEERYRGVEKIFRKPAPAEVWMLWRYGQHMLHSYGELHLKRGDAQKAEEFARECIAMAERSSALKNVGKGRRLLGQTLSAQGKPDEAERELRAALEVAREIGNPTQLWKTWAALGDVLTGDDAQSAYRQATAVIEGVAAGLSDEVMRTTFLASQQVSDVRAKVR
jgi:tetratricopeptide (TPR) repeat protein